MGKGQPLTTIKGNVRDDKNTELMLKALTKTIKTGETVISMDDLEV